MIIRHLMKQWRSSIIDVPSENSTVQGDSLRLVVVVFPTAGGVTALLGDWTIPAGLQEVANVFRGESSTAAFQISNCACSMLPHFNINKIISELLA